SNSPREPTLRNPVELGAGPPSVLFGVWFIEGRTFEGYGFHVPELQTDVYGLLDVPVGECIQLVIALIKYGRWIGYCPGLPRGDRRRRHDRRATAGNLMLRRDDPDGATRARLAHVHGGELLEH
ncbi:MAG: hypothetical protein WCF49_16815, partial [Xanthobacteraceae bacterium]